MGKRTVHCTTHCRSCGRCFSSTAAFDRHRAGPPDERRCRNPERVTARDGGAVLAAKSTSGVCELQSLTPEIGVVVWSLAASLERGFRGFGEAA